MLGARFRRDGGMIRFISLGDIAGNTTTISDHATLSRLFQSNLAITMVH
jgi:hypothetical protein